MGNLISIRSRGGRYCRRRFSDLKGRMKKRRLALSNGGTSSMRRRRGGDHQRLRRQKRRPSRSSPCCDCRDSDAETTIETSRNNKWDNLEMDLPIDISESNGPETMPLEGKRERQEDDVIMVPPPVNEDSNIQISSNGGSSSSNDENTKIPTDLTMRRRIFGGRSGASTPPPHSASIVGRRHRPSQTVVMGSAETSSTTTAQGDGERGVVSQVSRMSAWLKSWRTTTTTVSEANSDTENQQVRRSNSWAVLDDNQYSPSVKKEPCQISTTPYFGGD